MKFKKMSFILNMDSEEQFAAAVIVYILERKKKRKKKKRKKTWYLGKTLAHAKRCPWVLQYSYVRIKDRRCGVIYKISKYASLFVSRIILTYRNYKRKLHSGENQFKPK